MEKGIIVHVNQKNSEPLPYTNGYHLGSHLYDRISNTPFDLDLHDRNEWSPYTLSKVLPTAPDKKFKKDGIHSTRWSFIVRSLSAEMIQVFRGDFAVDPNIRVGKAVGVVKKIEKTRVPDFSSAVHFKTLSPIMIMASELAGGDNKVLGPEHPEYENVLADKITRSYNLYHGSEVKNGVEIWIDKQSKTQVRVTHRDDIFLPAWELEGYIRGNKDIIAHAYWGGIGAKTALGLGCWEVVDDGR